MTAAYIVGTTKKVEIISIGSRIIIKEDEKILIDMTDSSTPTIHSGYVGFSSSKHAGVEFDNVQISRPAETIVANVPGESLPSKSLTTFYTTLAQGKTTAEFSIANDFIPKPIYSPYKNGGDDWENVNRRCNSAYTTGTAGTRDECAKQCIGTCRFFSSNAMNNNCKLFKIQN